MLTSFKVSPKPFSKTLKAPSSKSYAARLLILAAMDPRKIIIKDIPTCSDTTHLIHALKKIGLKITQDQNEVVIYNSFPQDEKKSSAPIPIKIGDGGTTSRFLMALLSKGNNRYHLDIEKPMATRPMQELINALRKLGVRIEKYDGSFIIKGPAKVINKSLEIDCNRSGQFASALILAFGEEISLKIKNLHSSSKYILLTKKLIKDFKKNNCFTVPADWTSASYPLALGLITGRTQISNLKNPDPLQADSSFTQIINQMGGKIEFNEKGLYVKKKQLKKITLDCSSCLDLVPTLAFLCSRISEDSHLTGLINLKYKESHRLEEIEKLLALSKSKIVKHQNSLLIKKGGEIPFFEYQAPEDHRMVMTAYLFMRSGRGGIIYNAGSVNKSWPDFFKQMED